MGRKLAKDPPTEFQTETLNSDTVVVKSSKTSQKWASDYLTWNLAFITGNQGDFDLLLPKLLIPSVISADPEQFMFRRVYSLWLSINFCLFRNLQGNSKKASKDQLEFGKLFAKDVYSSNSDSPKIRLERFRSIRELSFRKHRKVESVQ